MAVSIEDFFDELQKKIEKTKKSGDTRIIVPFGELPEGCQDCLLNFSSSLSFPRSVVMNEILKRCLDLPLCRTAKFVISLANTPTLEIEV